MQEWISKYTCPAWMFVGRMHYPFGNERHNISCGLSTIMWFLEIVGGRYRPCECRRPEFVEIRKTVVTMLRRTRPIWNFAKVDIMDSGLCDTKGLVELQKKGVFGAALIKKRRYWPVNIKENWSLIALPLILTGQYLRFLMSAAPNTPFF